MKKSRVEDIGSYGNMQKQLQNDNHAFLFLPRTDEIGIIDSNQALENLSIIVERAKEALDNGFPIEFISLKIQYVEFFLRIYWVKRNPNGLKFTPSTRKFFGTLINECSFLIKIENKEANS